MVQSVLQCCCSVCCSVSTTQETTAASLVFLSFFPRMSSLSFCPLCFPRFSSTSAVLPWPLSCVFISFFLSFLLFFPHPPFFLVLYIYFALVTSSPCLAFDFALLSCMLLSRWAGGHERKIDVKDKRPSPLNYLLLPSLTPFSFSLLLLPSLAPFSCSLLLLPTLALSSQSLALLSFMLRFISPFFLPPF